MQKGHLKVKIKGMPCSGPLLELPQNTVPLNLNFNLTIILQHSHSAWGKMEAQYRFDLPFPMPNLLSPDISHTKRLLLSVSVSTGQLSLGNLCSTLRHKETGIVIENCPRLFISCVPVSLKTYPPTK
ncbi:hypothetical protein STEG23_015523, partial [Scotinomys teguina]